MALAELVVGNPLIVLAIDGGDNAPLLLQSSLVAWLVFKKFKLLSARAAYFKENKICIILVADYIIHDIGSK